MPARLRMRGIAKRFGATVALSGVDLALDAGEAHALIGENGAGKSTLVKVLSGALRADAGSMELDGAAYAPRGPGEARARGVAMIHQELMLCPHLDVEENIALGAEPARAGVIRGGERRAIARAALDQLGVDLPLAAPVATLPPASRQLVEIARALSWRPRVLVMDEPTSSLTAREIERLFAVVRRLTAAGVAVVYISHVLEECRALCHRFTVLRDGASVAAGELAAIDDRALIAAMVGREVGAAYPRSARTPGEPALAVERLDGAQRPRAASLVVRAGEVVGLFGLVGAGRTELARAIHGLDPVRAGTIAVDGAADRGAAPARRLAQGVGMVSEDRKEEGLALARSIADNLCLTRLGPYRRAGLLSDRRQHQAAAGLMRRLGVRAIGPGQAVGELSGGNQQKVAIARLLHHQARVWLLDEPCRGIDIGAKAAIYALIDELARDGAAILLISSYIPELLGVCDRIAVMRRGELGAARPVAEWSGPSLLATAIGGGVMDGAPPAVEAEIAVARASTLRRLWSALGPFLVLIGLVALLALVVGQPFLAANNLRNVLTQTVIVAVGALGMCQVIVAGGIDLSCGSVIALASVCAALALREGGGDAGAIAAAVAAGAAVGALNGAAIAWLRLPPFIVTLGMLGVARGLAKALAHEQTVNFAATWLDRLMRPVPRATDPAWQRALVVAPGVWLAAILALATALLMRRTVFGRHLYAIGSNEAAARLCGVRVERTKLALYAIAGAFSGCAGLLMMARLRQGDPTTAMGLELDIIAAVVIGGASLSGGVGSVAGSLVGALIMAVLRNGSQQLGWPNYMQEIIIGAVIVAAVAVDRLRAGRRA